MMTALIKECLILLILLSMRDYMKPYPSSSVCFPLTYLQRTAVEGHKHLFSWNVLVCSALLYRVLCFITVDADIILIIFVVGVTVLGVDSP